MATIQFRNGNDTNLHDISDNNITDATATGVSFTGGVGVDLTVDTATINTINVNDGECDVPCTGTGTYVVFKLTDDVSTGLIEAP